MTTNQTIDGVPRELMISVPRSLPADLVEKVFMDWGGRSEYLWGDLIEAIEIAGLSVAQPQGETVALAVWYGAMPESNGKTNWTAILHRNGECMSEGITIDRSEYPERVRYEADRMLHLIGVLKDEPDILAYDPDKHSGYVKAEQPAPVAVLQQVEIEACYEHVLKSMEGETDRLRIQLYESGALLRETSKAILRHQAEQPMSNRIAAMLTKARAKVDRHLKAVDHKDRLAPVEKS